MAVVRRSALMLLRLAIIVDHSTSIERYTQLQAVTSVSTCQGKVIFVKFLQ